ncbi:PREDICTED: uncharacterized J domain-containing protein C4H3.01-like isoform X1 [Nelumbo nucifera]|uniref:Uncharacterized J domain-containing protein C4H3.01-like isoform X1 n=1 Tax=Nelumbo nucifera TaxID=4432 RepID=A0A1U8B1P6_NELNU|nr:PREDICTED: uncharacterized J domain-containing protein C4H3.01-like isoform X1 [Nelumbo nucifera]
MEWFVGMNSDQSSTSYYNVLGVDKNSSVTDIRNAYRRLAMQWHPDRWTRTPSLLGEAKRKFQQIQEAYSVLSDEGKRTMYDAALCYDPDDETEDEGLTDFVQEMLSLMANVGREEKYYSMSELQQMFLEMAQGFEFGGIKNPPQRVVVLDEPSSSRASKWESAERPTLETDSPSQSQIQVPGLEMFGRTSLCN